MCGVLDGDLAQMYSGKAIKEGIPRGIEDNIWSKSDCASWANSHPLIDVSPWRLRGI